MQNSSGRPSRPAGRTRRPFSSNGPRRNVSSDRAPRFNRDAKPAKEASRFIYPDLDQGRTVRQRPISENGSDRPRRSFSSERPRSSTGGGFHRAGRMSRGGFSGGRSSNGGRRGRVQQTFDVSRFINLNPVKPVAEAPYQAKHTFNDFGLNTELASAIAEMGLVTPSPIQDQVIPLILKGHDVVGLAQTGTGKTAAFLVPVINMTLQNRGRQTLILTPTRELAIQVEQELRKLTPKMHIYSTVCVGGMNIRPQIMGLRKKNHFIIGTPGRVQDLIDRKHIKPGAITTVIFDEADRMLDMGFIHDMRQILKDIPDERETLFFSATMSKSVEGLVTDFLKDPVTISVRKTDITNSITQDVIRYEHHNKFDTLVSLLKKEEFSRVIIFGAMKHSVEKLSQELVNAGIKSDAIHGNKSHQQRQRALKNFKDSRVQVLVATDVAARGIHVDNVSHVINYDLPSTYEDYVHRIGRTGRSDKRGSALTFVPA
jgi:superfamily II DNA/RNA helicase